MSDLNSVDKAWRAVQRLHNLPDTAQMRQTFYHGARFAVDEMIDADEQRMLALNEELHIFGYATLARESK